MSNCLDHPVLTNCFFFFFFWVDSVFSLDAALFSPIVGAGLVVAILGRSCTDFGMITSRKSSRSIGNTWSKVIVFKYQTDLLYVVCSGMVYHFMRGDPRLLRLHSVDSRCPAMTLVGWMRRGGPER